MEKQYSRQFFHALVKALQQVCKSHLEFDEAVDLSGYLAVEIDSVQKERYVIGELVHASGSSISESFCSKVFRTGMSRSQRGTNGPMHTVKRRRSDSLENGAEFSRPKSRDQMDTMYDRPRYAMSRSAITDDLTNDRSTDLMEGWVDAQRYTAKTRKDSFGNGSERQRHLTKMRENSYDETTAEMQRSYRKRMSSESLETEPSRHTPKQRDHFETAYQPLSPPKSGDVSDKGNGYRYMVHDEPFKNMRQNDMFEDPPFDSQVKVITISPKSNTVRKVTHYSNPKVRYRKCENSGQNLSTGPDVVYVTNERSQSYDNSSLNTESEGTITSQNTNPETDKVRVTVEPQEYSIARMCGVCRSPGCLQNTLDVCKVPQNVPERCFQSRAFNNNVVSKKLSSENWTKYTEPLDQHHSTPSDNINVKKPKIIMVTTKHNSEQESNANPNPTSSSDVQNEPMAAVSQSKGSNILSKQSRHVVNENIEHNDTERRNNCEAEFQTKQMPEVSVKVQDGTQRHPRQAKKSSRWQCNKMPKVSLCKVKKITRCKSPGRKEDTTNTTSVIPDEGLVVSSDDLENQNHQRQCENGGTTNKEPRIMMMRTNTNSEARESFPMASGSQTIDSSKSGSDPRIMMVNPKELRRTVSLPPELLVKLKHRDESKSNGAKADIDGKQNEEMKTVGEKVKTVGEEVKSNLEDTPEGVQSQSSVSSKTNSPEETNICWRTVKKTQFHVKLLNKHLENIGESRQMHLIPAAALDSYLGGFFSSVKRDTGEDYGATTLGSIHCSIDRHLRKQDYPWNIKHDMEFMQSRKVLADRMVKLTRRAAAQRGKNTDVLTEQEVDMLYSKGLLGSATPESLLNTMWFHNSIHFNLPHFMDHYNLRWGNIGLHVDEDGREYLKMSLNDNIKVYAKNDNPEKCFVTAYKRYQSVRPNETCSPDAPFYLTVNRYHGDKQPWYKFQNAGINKLGSMMRRIATAAGLDKERFANSTCTLK